MSKKTFLEVQQQIKDLQAEAERLRKEESAEVLARIREAIAVYGFSASDLGFGKRPAGGGNAKAASRKSAASKDARPASAVPKYRDEEGNTWGGRGPRPAWIRAALEAGKTLEQLAA